MTICSLSNQPSAHEIQDKLIRQENQDLKKQLTDMETNRQVLEQRIAELQQCFDTVQTEKTSANKRITDQEENLRKKKEMRHTEKAKADKSQSHEEFEITEEKQRYPWSLPKDTAEITMSDSLQTAPQPQGHLEQEQSEHSDCVGGRIPFRDIDQKSEHRLQKKQEMERKLANMYEYMDQLEEKAADLELMLAEERKERKVSEQSYADLERCMEAELQEKNDLSVRYYELKWRLEAELQEKNDLSLRYADLERRLEAELQEKNDLSMRYADLERRHEAELQEKNDLSVRYADLESRLKIELQERIDISVSFAYLESLLEAELQEQNDPSVRHVDQERRIEAGLQEKNGLSMRSSAFIASRIKDGNTAIVDLSDENIPTKLAEYFSELYDNEWTDCFDDLENQAIEESEIIRILLKILTDIFNACLQWSTEDYFLLIQRAIDRTYIGQAENVTERPNITGSKTRPTGNEETPQKNDNTEATIESGDNAQDDVPSVSEGGPCNKESKADSESNEETPQTIDHTQATIESGEHGDAQSMKEDEDVLETTDPATDPAITAEESREKDQSDEPFHDNTKNGSSSEDQDGSRKAVTQCLRSQDETHTNEMPSITEEAESVQESENKCEVEASSATGDGPSKKEHESNAEASVYVEGSESTEAGQNGQGEEPSSTEVGDKENLPPREKEVELPNDLLQPIKEIKKRRALKVLPTIHEFVRRKIPTLVQARFASTYFQTYIQKCTEFSWLAVVQDPPLVLLADGGTKFDRKLFKEYKRRGQFAEFVVWPALLIDEGGAILSKGVAQGINKPP